jgi:hypothetical protein
MAVREPDRLMFTQYLRDLPTGHVESLPGALRVDGESRCAYLISRTTDVLDQALVAKPLHGHIDEVRRQFLAACLNRSEIVHDER